MFGKIKENWKYYALGNKDVNDRENVYIAEKLDALDETAEVLAKTICFDKDDLWDDLKTVSTKDMTDTYCRIYKMALAYGTYGSKLYKNYELKSKILLALEWMYNNRYGEKEIQNIGWRDIRAFNWYDWAIGSPTHLLNTLMIMEDDMEYDKVCAYLRKFDHSVPKVVDYGSNRFDFARLITIAGILQGNEKKIRYAIGECDDLFEICDDGKNDGQGFYSDGTYIFHTKHFMNGTYGFMFLKNAINFAVFLKDSEFDLSEDKKKKLVDWFIEGTIPCVQYGSFVRLACGRHVNFVDKNVPEAIALAMKTMEIAGETEKKIIYNFINEQLKYISLDSVVEELSNGYICEIEKYKANGTIKCFSKSYYYGDKVIHKREDYTFGIAMSSNRIYNYECINNQNLNGWYIGDGMSCLYNKDNRYKSDYWQSINPYYIPGTTVDSQERQEVSIRQSNEYLSNEDFVGCAVHNDMYSVAAMNLESYHSDGNFSKNDLFSNQAAEYGSAPPKHSCTLKAKKAWFMFDNEIVCLGADIKAEDNSPVRTIILNGKHNIEKTDYGFIASDFGSVVLQNCDYQVPEFGEYKAVTIEHGASPSNAGYIYTIYPNNYDLTNNDVEIICNTGVVQAVRHNKLNISGYVFRDAGVFDEIKVSDSLILIVSENKLSACDPTHKNRKITVEYKNKKFVFDFSNTNGKTLEMDI